MTDSNIQKINLTNDILPCCNGSKYYKGNCNIYNSVDKNGKSKCIDCEYIQAMGFIDYELSGYELEECCDLEESKKGKEKQPMLPDLLLVNKNNNKVVIEVKRIKNIKSSNRSANRIIIGKKNNVEQLLKSVYKTIKIEYEEMNKDIDELFNIILNSLTISMYINEKGLIYNPIYNKIALYYKGKRSKKRDGFIKSISKEVLSFILLNAKIICDKKKILKEYKFQVDDIGFIISLNNQEGFQGMYSERDEIISGIHFPKEYIKLEINEFYNDCKEKFINYYDCKKVLLIRNETYFYKDNIIDLINKIDKPDIIDEVWIEFIEQKEMYNEEIDDLEEVAIGKKYIKLN